MGNPVYICVLSSVTYLSLIQFLNMISIRDDRKKVRKIFLIMGPGFGRLITS